MRLGLVEHQHLRAARQAGGQRHQLALAAAQLGGGDVLRHAELVEQPARLAVRAVPAMLGPARQQALLVGEGTADPVEVGGQPRIRQAALDRGQLGLELGQLRPRGADPVQSRARVAGDVLGQEGVDEPAPARHRAGVGVLDAGEDAQQRRLAAAVGPQDADPHAVGELEVEPVDAPGS